MKGRILCILIWSLSCRYVDSDSTVHTFNENIFCGLDVNDAYYLDDKGQHCYLMYLIDEPCLETESSDFTHAIRLSEIHDNRYMSKIFSLYEKGYCSYIVYKEIPPQKLDILLYHIENNKEIEYSVRKRQLDTINVNIILREVNELFPNYKNSEYSKLFKIEIVSNNAYKEFNAFDSLTNEQQNLWNSIISNKRNLLYE